MIDKIVSAFERKSFGICVFLDYSKCFDTLFRNILLSKFERYGVRGIALDLLKSYFQNRNQVVEYHDAKSGVLAQNIGVIQGSKCGPLFMIDYL